ncbi:TPA: neutral zinc metallopeptidase [Streptococcus suis]
MKWQDVRQSKNVQDRRGQSSSRQTMGFPTSTGRSGSSGLGGGLLWLLLGRSSGKTKLLIFGLIILTMIFGSGGLSSVFDTSIYDQSIPPSSNVTEDQVTPSASQSASQTVTPLESTDEEVQFFSAVLATTEDFWHQMFADQGATYREPQLVIYTGGTATGGCGYGSAQAGPFYCPADETIYIDLQFYRDLETKYKAPGDFAMAYVIAHEVGHHVQKLDGTMQAYNNARQRLSTTRANELTVRLELQADYYAGAWAKYVDQQGLLDVGDIEEALAAANAVGDDTLQKEAYGYVVPDSFTHGTSLQRRTWFMRGYEYGDFEHGDSFNTEI